MRIAKRKITVIVFSFLIFSLLFSLFIKWIQTGDPFRSDTIMFGAIVFLNMVTLGSIGYIFLNKFSVKSSIQTKKQIIPAYLLFVLLAFILSLSIVSMGIYFYYLILGLDMSGFIGNLIYIELPSAVKQFTIWILLGSAFFFYIIWSKAFEREQILREENLKYKYRNIKAQINPHFLFNSLNTLSELVYIDEKRADNYIQKLSGIYRYILDNEENDLIPLDRELDFVAHYFDLQKERNDEKIILDMNVDDTVAYKIIPVSLQILLENALKHNTVSQNNPLKIKIYKNLDYIIVSNKIQRKSTMEKSYKSGLSNLKERVRQVTKRELDIREENGYFIVKLPIIKE